MKTIAVTIEDQTLQWLDRVAAAAAAGAGGGSNRSKIVRMAVREYLDRLERIAEENRARGILKRHARRLAQQAAALVKEQAKP